MSYEPNGRSCITGSSWRWMRIHQKVNSIVYLQTARSRLVSEDLRTELAHCTANVPPRKSLKSFHWKFSPFQYQIIIFLAAWWPSQDHWKWNDPRWSSLCQNAYIKFYSVGAKQNRFGALLTCHFTVIVADWSCGDKHQLKVWLLVREIIWSCVTVNAQ